MELEPRGGGRIAFHQAIGGEIHRPGQLDPAAFVPDLDGACGGCEGIVTQGDLGPDQSRLDLVEDAGETDRAVFVDLQRT